MSMNFTEVSGQVESFFNAFNILNLGLVVMWIVASIFLARAISKRKDEFVLSMIVFLMSGGLLFFASDPGKYVILVVVVFVVLIGLWKMLQSRKEESER